MLNRTNTLVAVLVAGLVSQSSTLAASAPEPELPIEEITVTGQRTMIALRMQISDAEDHLYELFNELNTDDRYDVHCVQVDRYFSHTKQKQCRVGYERDALKAEADYITATVTGMPAPALIPRSVVIAAELPNYQAKMRELVVQNPDLLDAVIKHAQLVEELDKQQKTYFNEEE